MATMKIHQALGDFRAEASVGKSGKNPMFKSEYTTLGDVLTALEGINGYGLTFIQRFDGDDLITEVVHFETGETLQSKIKITPEKHTPQSFISCVTYMRRASLMTMFGLNADDDDGNRATFSGGARPSSDARPAKQPPAAPPPKAAGGTVPDSTLEAALASCVAIKDVNAVYVRLFKSAKIEPTAAQLAKLSSKKEALKND
jgi:hypothetical protein